jgi:hypothetical protein
MYGCWPEINTPTFEKNRALIIDSFKNREEKERIN